ncbi:hypothetical protein PPYR_14960 [Photinus pyralis]|uniref:XPG-I domain-containing protein n=1 Tax=Photinus pyralis TaxID=7054 RepID=A0A5N4A0N0_PHOPY|nr:hypothetical protein PPYR_14960 [Photinus pyralis]
MGIKHLWSILTPFVERRPLYELEGKSVAIDLSGWVCEAQNVTDYYTQPKMYLRNLYFRTCFLLLMQVSPIFVLEGKPPELKHDTIAARNATQFKGAKPRSDGAKNKSKDRARFRGVLNCCEEMLRYMGVACVKGKGEAESLCAYLNMNGLVDGCVTQDSDCFAYGAKIVYRNFSISQQGANSGAGAIDVYDITKIYESIKIGRNKMVAMALLCGSDYSCGVFGIGKEAVVKFFEHVADDEVLERLRSWRTDGEFYRKLNQEVTNKNVCSVCGHQGKKQSHVKYGCGSCGTRDGCDPSTYEKRRLENKNEISIREKALKDEDFPNEELISEFLHSKEEVKAVALEWRRPNIAEFIAFAVKHLQWEHVYAFEKFLPILTRWHLSNSVVGALLRPKRIKKARHLKGVAGFEIIWEYSAPDQDLFPSHALDEIDSEKLWSTVEPQHLVRSAYPDLVDEFERATAKPKRPAKKKATVAAPKRKPRRIESYFTRTELDVSKFGDESDLDLSDLIEDVVSSDVDYLQALSESVVENLDESNFFATTFTECDLFEKSMAVLSTDSSDDEEEYVPLIERIQSKQSRGTFISD